MSRRLTLHLELPETPDAITVAMAMVNATLEQLTTGPHGPLAWRWGADDSPDGGPDEHGITVEVTDHAYTVTGPQGSIRVALCIAGAATGEWMILHNSHHNYLPLHRVLPGPPIFPTAEEAIAAIKHAMATWDAFTAERDAMDARYTEATSQALALFPKGPALYEDKAH